MTEDKPQIYIDRSSGCAGAGLGGILCSGVGGVGLPIVGFAELGFGWGLVAAIPAAIFGGGAGVLAGFLAGSYLGYRAEEKDIKLDERALAQQTPFVTITYRESSANCILRDDYGDSGHVFRLGIENSDLREVSLGYNPGGKEKFVFQVGIGGGRLHPSESEYEIKVLEKVGGIEQIYAGVERENGRLVASVRLESDKVGPDEIFHISKAATGILEVVDNIPGKFV